MIAAFGGSGPAVRLPGGEGRSWRATDIVLKPADKPADELEWQAALLGSVEPSVVRVAPPRRSADGNFVVDGWYATDFMVGTHEPGKWAEIIRAGEAVHAAIAAHPRPGLLDRRADRWAIGDRVAWDEIPTGDYSDTLHLASLAAARRPLGAPSQLIHGDLTGNVLFADDLPPAIIDFSPYWRPAPFASAIVVADAIVWEGADPSVLEAVSHIDRFGQYLVRALIFRLVSDAVIGAGQSRKAREPDPFVPAVELALSIED